jgi:hypothetical protein
MRSSVIGCVFLILDVFVGFADWRKSRLRVRREKALIDCG